jgi:Actin
VLYFTVSLVTVTDSYASDGFLAVTSQMGKERYTAPELLFQPTLDINSGTSVSVVDLVMSSFESFVLSGGISEDDLKGYQNHLAYTIVLTGAGSKLRGITQRLQVSKLIHFFL